MSQNTKDTKNTNEFEKKYSSKINPLYIPIPGFKFYHGSSSEGSVDDKFIGRERIIDRLKSWLINDKPKTGVYLVTGFRGMGKSSFVGKVLNEITEKTPKWQDNILKIFCCLICVIIFLSAILLLSKVNYSDEWKTVGSFFKKIPCKMIIVGTGLFILSLLVYRLNGLKDWIKDICRLKFIGNWFNGGYWKRYRKGYWKDHPAKRKRIPIKLNLGHEILNERDILSLIANSIEYEYNKYLSNFTVNRRYFYRKWIFITIITSLLSIYVLDGLNEFINDTIYRCSQKCSGRFFIYTLIQTFERSVMLYEN